MDKRGSDKRCKLTKEDRRDFLFPLAQQPPVGQGLLIHQVSRSHTTTRHSR